MEYVVFGVCFLLGVYLYYRLYIKYRKDETNMDILLMRYVELMQMYNEKVKEHERLNEKYKYKLSLVATYQDKLSEIGGKLFELEKKYNLLVAVYNENKDNLDYAQSLLSGDINEI